MDKECWQLAHPNNRTTCFELAKCIPCSKPDCLVDDVLRTGYMRFAYGNVVTPGGELANAVNLSHRLCRMSISSPDNAEFKQRTRLG